VWSHLIPGVVVGILRHDNTIDAVRMAVIRSISHPMELTFHRAFDVCSTPLTQAIEEVISLGCDRLLTSGRAPTAVDSSGTQCLYEIMAYLNRKTHDHDNNSSITHFPRLQIVAASGIKVTNVRELILSTGVHGVHAGSAVVLPASQNLEGNLIDPSFEGEGRGCVDEDLVGDFVEESEESWNEIERDSV
jgi:copper homeostasis protein